MEEKTGKEETDQSSREELKMILKEEGVLMKGEENAPVRAFKSAGMDYKRRSLDKGIGTVEST